MSEVIQFIVSEGKPQCEVEGPRLNVVAKLIRSMNISLLKIHVRCDRGTVRLVDIVTDDTEQVEARRVDTILSSCGEKVHRAKGLEVFGNYILFVRLRGPRNVSGEIHYERRDK